MDGVDPHTYPGDCPNTSFITDGHTATPLDVLDSQGLTVIGDEQTEKLDDFLRQQGVPGLAERIPVVAYGANLNPNTLRKKMDYGGQRPDMQIIPTLYGQMKGIDVVWGERPGNRGAFFAELYADEQTADTTVRMGVNLLTPAQLLLLHRTEVSYILGRYSEISLDNGQSLPAIMYAGHGRVLQKDGRPVAAAGWERERSTLPELTSRQAFDFIMRHTTVQQHIVDMMSASSEAISADSFSDYLLALETPKERTEQVRNLIPVVRAAGLSSSVALRESLEEEYPWANPSGVPRYGELIEGQANSRLIRMPEQELPFDAENGEASQRRSATLRAVRRHFARLQGRLA